MEELLHNLRRKRIEKLDKRQGDLRYLSQIGLDAKDAQLEKEKAHIESRIAHWEIKLTTAKFLHDKVSTTRLSPYPIVTTPRFTPTASSCSLSVSNSPFPTPATSPSFVVSVPLSSSFTSSLSSFPS